MKLGYIVIYVEDVPQVINFYKSAFGFETRFIYEQQGNIDYGELETGDTVLAFASHQLGEMNLQGKYEKVSAKGNPFGYELAFVSDDVNAAYQKAIEAGAISVSEPTEKPWGQTVAYVRAQEGTLIEICNPIPK
ncbi:Lactoylglutathione lyase [Hyella patelloides LEGE 07179]|uniref:Lactoylglutathione lyase n=1 Tax=Hyella patelloides LEGE 07179 TaxID=945734 RepID=A0A563VJD8_9CYAN|nr:VOC family protein [Hyella patelloides]VEP11570.1 Lactoylglutathione lyase [Hyella patelloides LEGE 07179]